MSQQLVSSMASPERRKVLGHLLASSSKPGRSILPFLPPSVRYFLVTLVLLNYRSFPLVWHFRVFSTFLAMKVRILQRWFSEYKRRHYVESVSPVGKSPFDMMVTYQTYCGFSDTDFNAHLSNSAYAKNLDFARLRAVVTCFPSILEAKGWLALGDSHYHFLKEIPMFTPYEIRMSIGGWDSKWLYVVAQFVTYPKKKSTSKNEDGDKLTSGVTSASGSVPSFDNVVEVDNTDFGCLSQLQPIRPAKKFFLPPDRRGSISNSSSSSASSYYSDYSDFEADDPNNVVFDVDSNHSGPSTAASSPPNSSPQKSERHLPSHPSTPASRSRNPSNSSLHSTSSPQRGLFPAVPEGAVLHSTHVSSYVFKHGRITIPPRVALVASGFGDPSVGRWERLQELRNTREVRCFEGRPKAKGELGGLQSILAGGWKMYEEEGLWDLPEYEQMRSRGVEELGCLRSRMDGYYKAD